MRSGELASKCPPVVQSHTFDCLYKIARILSWHNFFLSFIFLIEHKSSTKKILAQLSTTSESVCGVVDTVIARLQTEHPEFITVQGHTVHTQKVRGAEGSLFEHVQG